MSESTAACDRCRDPATTTARCWMGCEHQQCVVCALWTNGEAHDEESTDA